MYENVLNQSTKKYGSLKIQWVISLGYLEEEKNNIVLINMHQLVFNYVFQQVDAFSSMNLK